MTEPGRLSGSNGGRRAKRFLSPSQKYEIWLALVRGEVSTVEAADRAGVDRSTIVKLRQVGKQGAGRVRGVATGGAPRRPGPGARGCEGGDRALGRGDQGDGRPADAGGGKRALGLSGRVPRRATRPPSTSFCR
jgi:hypothetical protein